MKVRLSPDEEAVVRSARRFARERLRPNLRAMDEADRFDTEAFAEAAELGFTGLMIPETYGGIGTNVRLALVVLEELGTGSPAFALSLGAHFLLFGHNLVCEGSDELKRRYLPSVAAGRRIGALALTEPAHGSDAAGIETTARRSSDVGYMLTGTKTFITNAPVADLFFVYARTAPGRHGLSAFVVERGFPGVRTGAPMKKMGNRSSPTGEVAFDSCPVPAGNLVGRENEGLAALMRGLDIERILLPSIYVGAMRWSIEIAHLYATHREQFGQLLKEFQIIQAKLAEMTVRYEVARVYLWAVAAEWQVAPGARELRGSAAAAKVVVGRAAEYVTREAIQILGGSGYLRDANVEMLYRDARLASIGAGTEEIDLLLIYRGLSEGDFL